MQIFSIPTKDEILVPETLLKKRKSQEKEREAKTAERDAKRKVCQQELFLFSCFSCGDDTTPNMTRPLKRVDVVLVNHLSGLSNAMIYPSHCFDLIMDERTINN